MTLAEVGIDPAPIAAWLALTLAAMGIVTGVVAAIAALWRWVALPQIVRLIDSRLDAVDAEHTDSIRRLHERLDAHLLANHRSSHA